MNDKSVLVVDDSDFFLEMVKTFLGRTGCDVLTAHNWKKALEILGKRKPDLILMDLYMREMKGDECCREIKAKASTKDIPVIMLTTASNMDDRAKCLSAGCDDYITKPINKMDFLNKIKKYLHIEIREHRRAPIYTDVEFTSDGSSYSGKVCIISEGGLFIKTETIIPSGKNLKASFGIADIIDIIEVEGDVVWTTKERTNFPPHLGSGMGLKFTQISEEGKKAVATYINLGSYII